MGHFTRDDIAKIVSDIELNNEANISGKEFLASVANNFVYVVYQKSMEIRGGVFLARIKQTIIECMISPLRELITSHYYYGDYDEDEKYMGKTTDYAPNLQDDGTLSNAVIVFIRQIAERTTENIIYAREEDLIETIKANDDLYFTYNIIQEFQG